MRFRSMLLLLLFAGCGTSNPATDAADAAGWTATSPAESVADMATATANAACTAPPLADISTLPSCCTVGSAHCVPTASVPAVVQTSLDSCTGGYCVPDEQITSGGAAPPSCTSFGGATGVCLSLCVPSVAQNMALLPQDVCTATERCAPCINPLTNMPTGACLIGTQLSCSGATDGGTSSDGDAATAPVCPHTGPPLIDPTTLPACGAAGDAAHCLSASLVPTALVSQLAACTGGYCVPDVFIESGGNFVPATCASLDDAEGRCLDVVLPAIASQASLLPVSTCQSYERCAPCYSPIDGSDTGACHLSCDPGPTQPKVTFPSCCKLDGVQNPQGSCVPSSAVPSSESDYLSQQECSDSDLCVPSENLAASFAPKACSAFNLLDGGDYTGVCLSNCLDFGFFEGIAISQGDCDDQHSCTPCTSGGSSTGAPGCPP